MSRYTTKRIHKAPLYSCLLALSRLLRPLYQLWKSCYLHHVKAIWRKFNGYQFGVLCCAWTSGAVLIMNVLMTIWAGSSFGTEGGIGTLHSGSCTRSSNFGFWIHLLINILSTTLLGASNYTMQCLNSPSRAEIDKAHREGTWLDVGLPSVSNIWKILGYRRVLWWALALSTIPLHLLWNSAVFVSLSSHEYAAWSVPSDYLQIVNTNTSIESLKSKYFPPPAVSPSGTQSNYSGIFDNETYTSPSATTNETLYHQPLDQWPDDIIEDFLNISKQIRNNIQGFEKLSRQECLRKYVGPIISNRADVLLVSSNESTLWRQRLLIDRFDVDFSTYSTYDSTGAGAWICNDTDRGVTGYECDLQGAASKVDSSVFANEDIVSCYSLWAEEHCKLQFSAIIMVIVTVCNFIKLLCMTYVAWRRDAEPLITLGDAISSFLRREDTTTKGACLAGQAYFQQERRIRRLKTVSTFLKSPCNQIKCDWGLGNDGVHIRSPVLWKPIRRRRFATASGFRWAWCIGLLVFCPLLLTIS